MKDFRVVARIYNNQLRERREALGLSSSAFAEKAGVHPSYYCAFETLRASPLRMKQGIQAWSAIARRIAAALDVEPRVLWPESALAVRVTKTERRLNAEEIATLDSPTSADSPFGLLTAGEKRSAIESALRGLSDREAQILRWRFGFDGEPMTLKQIAERLERSTDRIRQIEAKALRKLREPSSPVMQLETTP